MATSDIHTLPIGDLVDHDETRTCWCGPSVVRDCPDCDEVAAGCWLCEGEGVIPADPETDAPCHVRHNAADGRE